jgi:hypothetical protein
MDYLQRLSLVSPFSGIRLHVSVTIAFKQRESQPMDECPIVVPTDLAV